MAGRVGLDHSGIQFILEPAVQCEKSIYPGVIMDALDNCLPSQNAVWFYSDLHQPCGEPAN